MGRRGQQPADDARGLVSLDYDRDGDLDVLVTNHAEPARLFENQSTGQGNRLTVRLFPDPLAIGASVHATVVSIPSVGGGHCSPTFKRTNEPVP